MQPAVLHVQSSRSKHYTIAVPANAGTADTIMALLLAAGLPPDEKHLVIGGRIAASAIAYNIGDSVSSQPWQVAIGFEYEEPVTDWLHSYIKSAGLTFNIAVTVYLVGSPVPGVGE